jgi:N-acylglucosamine 2-epimerase
VTAATIAALKEKYRQALEESVIPFWERHSLDREHGGYLTCLERDGTVFDTDKFVWLQAREVWMFARLYTSYKKEPAWLEYARLGGEFLRRHGRDGNGDWYFAVDRTGRPLVEAYNIFSDCFAAAAFAELYRAAGEEEARDLALATFRRILERKDNPKGRFTKQIGAARPLRALALPMIQLWLMEEMGDLFEAQLRERLTEEAIRQVVDLHIDRERQAVFERVAPDGSHPECMEGRLLCPGHALEVLWFVLRLAERRGDRRLIGLVSEAMLWTVQRGWDHTFGGLYYYQDYAGLPTEKLEASMKLWWVHAEALCAFLLAYKVTGKDVFGEWFQRLDEYSWARFADPAFGEWFGYLHREGHPAFTLKGGKWKGFFHLPRSLLACLGFLRELEEGSPGKGKR